MFAVYMYMHVHVLCLRCRLKQELLTPQFFPQSRLDRSRGQLAQWGGDLDSLQFCRVDAVPTQPVSSGEEPVRQRRKSLNRRCLHLKDELDEAAEVLGAVQGLQDGERAARAEQGLLYDAHGLLLLECPPEGEERPEEQEQFVDDAYHEGLRIPLLDRLEHHDLAAEAPGRVPPLAPLRAERGGQRPASLRHGERHTHTHTHIHIYT